MIQIRPATVHEVKDLQMLNNEVFVDNASYDEDLDLDWAMSEKGFRYFSTLVHDPSSLCLIAEDDSRKIGYLAIRPKEIEYRKSKYAEVQNMGVIPEYRSQGIGKKLLFKSIDWAHAQGYTKVFVCSYAQNKRAIDFYKLSGFSEIDVSLEKTI
jgi:ribosomal protein S18 acetylase RimI-like enzyme